MAILGDNQDILRSQIQRTFNSVNLTYTETDTNRCLLKSLQKDILQINNTVHCLSKELKALFHSRNFFIIMFQLRSHLATLRSAINLVRTEILSILNQVLAISFQKLKLALVNHMHCCTETAAIKTFSCICLWLLLLFILNLYTVFIFYLTYECLLDLRKYHLPLHL